MQDYWHFSYILEKVRLRKLLKAKTLFYLDLTFFSSGSIEVLGA